jgi:anti-sigma factor RsiW
VAGRPTQRPLQCGQVLELLSDYLDGDLPASDRFAVPLHLSGCPECTRFAGELAATVSALHRLRGVIRWPPGTSSGRS